MPEGIYKELTQSTISSFLRFMAHRYKAVPVKNGAHAIRVPEHEPCATCKSEMTATHRAAGDQTMRIQWSCPSCKTATWRTYGTPPGRERRSRWH
jgi:hypothetical protein